MDLRISRAVEEIILIRQEDRGRSTTRTVYRRRKRRKTGTAPLDSLGKTVEKIVSGQQTAAQEYLRRHDRSNREQRDGWLRDLPYNVFRGTRRGARIVRRAFGLPPLEERD